jgi:hypothetical protein
VGFTLDEKNDVVRLRQIMDMAVSQRQLHVRLKD